VFFLDRVDAHIVEIPISNLPLTWRLPPLLTPHGERVHDTEEIAAVCVQTNQSWDAQRVLIAIENIGATNTRSDVVVVVEICKR